MIPESGRSPGGGNGNPLEYSGLENLLDRGAWQAIVLGFAESDMTEQLRTIQSTQGTVWCCINYKATKILKTQYMSKGSLD